MNITVYFGTKMHQTSIGKKVEEVMGHTSTCFLQQRGTYCTSCFNYAYPEIFYELTIQSSDPDEFREKVYAAANAFAGEQSRQQ